MPQVPSITRLTAAGRGAVAVIRVRFANPGDTTLLQQHFLSATGKELANVTPGLICYGHWGGEGVVLVRTDDCEWEIHCHGGDAAVLRIQGDLQSAAGDIDVNVGDSDDLENRLLDELLRCRTQRTANYLLCQHQGLFRDFLAQVIAATGPEETQEIIQSFLATEQFATHLTNPWKVAICGRPNAGKSSLLNAVLGYDRAIVYDQPGTTRDRIAAEVVIDGWPFEFFDTAGLRDETSDDIEAAGIEAARAVLQEADQCVLVVDSVKGWTAEDDAILEGLPASDSVVIAWNKSDLTESLPAPDQPHPPVIQISALNNVRINDLLKYVAKSLVPTALSEELPLAVLPDINSELHRFLSGDSELNELQTTLQKYL